MRCEIRFTTASRSARESASAIESALCSAPATYCPSNATSWSWSRPTAFGCASASANAPMSRDRDTSGRAANDRAPTRIGIPFVRVAQSVISAVSLTTKLRCSPMSRVRMAGGSAPTGYTRPGIGVSEPPCCARILIDSAVSSY